MNELFCNFLLFCRSCLSRVDRLKQLITKKQAGKKTNTSLSKGSDDKDIKQNNESDGDDNDEDDDDDSDIDGMFDWRAKMA